MRKVTIKDVAKTAGVSRQTVSRAINDKGEISPETKERVLAAVEKLGYRPNRLAQSMITRQSMTIGLVVPDITNLFFPEVARGVQDAGRENGYNILLCNTDDDPEEEIINLRSLQDHQVDGIIIVSSLADEENLAKFADGFAPIVLFNRAFSHPNVSLIMTDNKRGGYLATEHLISLGHRRIGMIAPHSSQESKAKRVQGYQEALRAVGIEPDPDLIVREANTLHGGYQGMKKLLSENPEITAIFTYNDLLALGAMRACWDAGRRIPEDIAIIGFDDISLASMVTPSLSSIHVDKYELGRLSLMRLLSVLSHSENALEPLSLSLDLVVRESTAG